MTKERVSVKEKDRKLDFLSAALAALAAELVSNALDLQHWIKNSTVNN